MLDVNKLYLLFQIQKYLKIIYANLAINNIVRKLNVQIYFYKIITSKYVFH